MGTFTGQNVQKTTPSYLITIERGKKELYFIATKLELGSTYIKVVGFYINQEENKIKQEYQQLIQNTDKNLYMELILPYQRILEIRNLIYRQK
jgi:hypothetical protein